MSALLTDRPLATTPDFAAEERILLAVSKKRRQERRLNVRNAMQERAQELATISDARIQRIEENLFFILHETCGLFRRYSQLSALPACKRCGHHYMGLFGHYCKSAVMCYQCFPTACARFDEILLRGPNDHPPEVLAALLVWQSHLGQRPPYSFLLADLHWDVLRSRALLRDDFTCQSCGTQAPDARLQIHHANYAGYLPWDTTLANLTTLCHRCHCNAHTETTHEA